MIFHETKLARVFVITLELNADERGFLLARGARRNLNATD